MTSTLSPEELSSLCDGSHGDPFKVLGLHKEDIEGNEKLVLRIYRPDAEAISVTIGSTKPVDIPRVENTDLFELIFPRRKNLAAYTLTVTPKSGESFKLVDPYAFGPQVSDFDLQLWGEGNHKKAYEFMGAHPKTIDGVEGILFTVSAPIATRVSVIGNFNQWDGRVHRMRKYYDQGLWEIFIPGIELGTEYKYEIKTPVQDVPLKKADPYAFHAQLRPDTASKVYDLSGYDWSDDEWVNRRTSTQKMEAPISIYELHAGSWRRKMVDDESEFLTYRELAEELVPYVKDLGYTHIELLPIAEHPYDPSWGYQITGYYAPTSRFGTPHDFMYFVDECHKAGIGVIVDWVPAHFAKDDHGLRRFDGTGLYEHEDSRQGEHKDWGTCIFNFGRTEVINFLLSNAIYWVDKFHIDGLRVDAVASMLYLDYSREDGEWIPNKYGGRENIEAIDFLRNFNDSVHEHYPGVITFAEESTSWGGVSRPTNTGGLGFDFKWNMGWMNDTLTYIEKDPIYRKFHQGELTFSLIYAFSENFTLPFSHDEVVHMKKAMLTKMPGDDWQRFANLRLLYTYMYAHPGKKLLFMGSEFGQWQEWSEARSLDWHLLDWESHQGIQKTIRDLNALLKKEPALHQADFDWRGFEWIDFNDSANSILSFVRRAQNASDFLVTVLNFTPNVHKEYKIGVPEPGEYTTIFNSDSTFYGGSNVGEATFIAEKGEWQNQPAYITLTIPPLAGVILKPKK